MTYDQRTMLRELERGATRGRLANGDRQRLNELLVRAWHNENTVLRVEDALWLERVHRLITRGRPVRAASRLESSRKVF